MKKTTGTIILCFLLGFLIGCGKGEESVPVIGDVVQEKQNTYSCSFDGMKHTFILDLPMKSECAPLVLFLPGYGDTAEAFRSEIHFEKEAVPLGYAVAYVTGAPDPSSPTSAVGWNSDSGHQGNRDVEFLTALSGYLQDKYLLDPSRTYAVGFSNGAFMTHRLAMEASDTFHACVSVAGLMKQSVWEMRRESNAVGFFQITGEKDNVVPKNRDGSAKYANAPAIEEVMEYWAASNGLEQSETGLIGDGSELTKYTGVDKAQQVWHLIISNGRHSWPSERYNLIDINALILEFLEVQKEE